MALGAEQRVLPRWPPEDTPNLILWFYESHEAIASRVHKVVTRSFSELNFPDFLILSLNQL